MDGTSVEKQTLPFMTLKNDDLAKRYQWNMDSQTFGRDIFEPGALSSIKANHSLDKDLEAEFEQINEDRTALREFIFNFADDKDKLSDAWPLPVNLKRIIWNAKHIFNVKPHDLTDLTPDVVIEGLNYIIRTIFVGGRDDPISQEVKANALFLFSILLRCHLSSKQVIVEHRMTRKCFEWVVGEVIDRYQRAMCTPGEMVGSIAAQSLGEPTTQMTLNTFHYAGVSAKNVTLGVPRLKELINVNTTIKTPSLRIYLTDDVQRDENASKAIQADLEHATLRRIIIKSQIIFDPNPESTVIQEDMELVNVCIDYVRCYI